ncbi:MAG TPA: YadA-like family protein, partial [Bradyrhizobium sp.]|nr:YadA-like family protein [Bradyrhizobium sp.]
VAIGSNSSASGANAIAMGTGAQATQPGAIAIGVNSASTGANAIAIGTGATATGSVAVGAGASASNGGAAYGDGAVATATNSTAMGPNSSATAANSVAVGSGSTNAVANTVSFGSAGNERRLTNVAAGISQTDAVNVGQLQSVASGFQSQIGGLQTQIDDNRWEARGGVALALAASGLRYDDRPGKLSVAGSFGNFKGESGLAFGVGYAATNRLRFNASVSGVPSQGSVGGVVGGSITLN